MRKRKTETKYLFVSDVHCISPHLCVNNNNHDMNHSQSAPSVAHTRHNQKHSYLATTVRDRFGHLFYGVLIDVPQHYFGTEGGTPFGDLPTHTRCPSSDDHHLIHERLSLGQQPLQAIVSSNTLFRIPQHQTNQVKRVNSAIVYGPPREPTAIASYQTKHELATVVLQHMLCPPSYCIQQPSKRGARARGTLRQRYGLRYRHQKCEPKRFVFAVFLLPQSS
jgi:hypothetical protein